MYIPTIKNGGTIMDRYYEEGQKVLAGINMDIRCTECGSTMLYSLEETIDPNELLFRCPCCNTTKMLSVMEGEIV